MKKTLLILLLLLTASCAYYPYAGGYSYYQYPYYYGNYGRYGYGYYPSFGFSYGYGGGYHGGYPAYGWHHGGGYPAYGGHYGGGYRGGYGGGYHGVSRAEEPQKIRAHIWRRITLSSTQQKRANYGPFRLSKQIFKNPDHPYLIALLVDLLSCHVLPAVTLGWVADSGS